jgi:hypothetical protein
MTQDPNQNPQRNDTTPDHPTEEVADPNIPLDPADPVDHINVAYNQVPATGDPIGEHLEGETDSESLEYYQDDILDEDPTLGTPKGIANEPTTTDHLEDEVADEDENVLDRIAQIERKL